eukprot:UC1_evm1s2026
MKFASPFMFSATLATVISILFLLISVVAVTPTPTTTTTTAAVTAVSSSSSSYQQQNNVSCVARVGIDLPYDDIVMLHNVPTTAACCAACQQNRDCGAWVWAPAKDATTPEPHLCWLKKVVGGHLPSPATKPNRISCALPSPPSPPPGPPPGPASRYSQRYRNWTYYQNDAKGFVIPPNPQGPDMIGANKVDCSIVWLANVGAPLFDTHGKWRMFYTFFNETGYQTALATSHDLLSWNTTAVGRVFSFGRVPGSFDYGGVTFGGLLYNNASITSPRTLYRNPSDGSFYVLYGSYPNRNGYESGAGAQGVAYSKDGVSGWTRVSQSVPIVSTHDGAKAWERDVVYQPNAVRHNGSVYNFYNAHGTNQYGKPAEESGLAVISASKFPGVDQATNSSLWQRYAGSPVIPSGPHGAYDTLMASDPKVFWDAEQGIWVMFYFGVGDGSGGHADILFACSSDLLHWDKDPVPLYKAGAHPQGTDSAHAHKVSIVFDNKGTGYMYYTAVGPYGRGIALLTSHPVVY